MPNETIQAAEVTMTAARLEAEFADVHADVLAAGKALGEAAEKGRFAQLREACGDDAELLVQCFADGKNVTNAQQLRIEKLEKENASFKAATGTGSEATATATAAATAPDDFFQVIVNSEETPNLYDMLRKEYPKSEHQVQAHVLGVQSKLRVYQGQLYDGTPLNQADEVAEQTLIQFGGELGPEQSRLKEARTQVLEEKAARDLAYKNAREADSKHRYAVEKAAEDALVNGGVPREHAETAMAIIGDGDVPNVSIQY